MNALEAQSTFVRQIVDAVRSVIGGGPAVLHEPRFSGNEWNYVKACLDSSYVSSAGPSVNRFEVELGFYTGAKYVIAVINGTAALHVCLRLAGVGPGDEVLLPALTFVATANAVVYCGGIPHFVDSEERTLGMDPGALREYLSNVSEIRGGQCVNRVTGRVIRAVVPMHVFGHPADIEGVLGVARDFHLVVVEDAAESLGSTSQNRHAGTFGLMGTLSFNGNKIVTTGGGGAILTNNSELAHRARHLTTIAKLPHPWEYRHDEVGYNYRLPDLNAALGLAQLEQLPEMLAAKRRIAKRYQAAFARVPHASVVVEPEGCRSNYWLQAVLLDESVAGHRDAVLAAANRAEIGTRPIWTLMHRLIPYRECPRMDLPVAESLEQRLINLPSSAHLDTVSI